MDFLWKIMRILSYDIESTTGSHSDGSMCTFGYVISNENFDVLEQKDIVMKPLTRRFETRVKLHYEKEYIKQQPRLPVHYEEIKQLFASADLVIGFSVSNDVEFLNNACELYKLPRILYNFLDVQLLYKTVNNRPNMQGLEGIANELSIDYLAHRSDEDARVTLLLLKHLCKEQGLTVNELLRKFHITLGVNEETEVTPCTNGVYTHKEINFLISEFIDKNRRHSRRYKGGLSFKTFAFCDELRYGNVDLFRRIIKRIYELNGKIGQIESSNVFVMIEGKVTEKELKALGTRNHGRKRINEITLEQMLKMAGPLPEIDFSSDVELIKNHRLEIKKQREERRREKRKEYYKNKANEQKAQENAQ